MIAIAIRILSSNEAKQILPLAQQLNPDVDKKELEQRLILMLNYGDQCIGVFHENKLIGCCVLRISARFCYGRYCDIDNVIIDANFRDQGIATKLFDWIHAYAKEQGCKATVLDSYVDNKTSHGFYEKVGYQNMCQHFFRALV